MKVLTQVSAVAALLLTSGTTSALAQSITTSKDGTGTQVTSASGNPNQFNIKGGTRAGANLFHSFEKFGLSKGQIANFMSNPSTRNILGRVVGGDASRINGLIKVTGGNSNLFLINPAGFLFGPNASLNLPGSFTATTANGIQIGDYWFDAMGQNNYANLVGEPNGFAFVSDTPGSIMNAGTLSVPQGEQITLVGGMVINTGTLEAPGGKVTIASVPNKQLVKISQEGNLLSLGLPSSAESVLLPGVEGFTPLALPKLLTGGDEPIATGVIADADGVRLTGNDAVLPTDPGTTLVAGTVDVSGPEGGTVHVLGDKVGLLGANINSSGDYSGGTVLLGGDYKGLGEVPNATRTFIDRNSVITADALKNGPGGKVIAWADGVTAFYGNISARGGEKAGDGGFVEVSGKENLIFQGSVDLNASNGVDGTLLLDPENVNISGDSTTIGVNPSQVFGNDDSNDSDINIDAEILGAVDGQVFIEARNNITISSPVTFVNSGADNSITFRADSDGDNDGEFTSNAPLLTNGRPLTVTAANVIINNEINPGGSDVTLEATSSVTLNADIGPKIPREFGDGFFFDNNNPIDAVFLPKNIETLTVKVNPENGKSGVIEVLGNINTKSLILENSNGNITIGEKGNPVEIFIATYQQIQSEPTKIESIGGLAQITANNGSINLYGGVTLDAKASLVVDAQKFTAKEAITRNFKLIGRQDELIPIAYNIGVISAGGSDLVGERRNIIKVSGEEQPEIQFSVQFLNKKFKNKARQTVRILPNENSPNGNFMDSSFDPNYEGPDIQFTIREDTSFKIGKTLEPTDSGIELSIQNFKVADTNGAAVNGQLSSGGRNFETDIITDDDPPNDDPPNDDPPNDDPPNDDPPNDDPPDNTQKTRQNTSDDENTTEGSDYLPTNCSVTNTGQVQCSQAGKVLALTFDPPLDAEGNVQFPISPEQFPELLTGDDDLGYIQDLETPANSSAMQFNSKDQSVKMSFEKADLNLDKAESNR